MLKVVDLFSGIGGFSYGFRLAGGFETVAFCEIDPFCRRVLAKHWPGVPIHADIRALTGDEFGPVDVVSGGFPCQPWSLAGKRGGIEDDRDLWPEMRRIIGVVRPRWVIGENVPGLDDKQFMGLDRVLSDLEDLGYTAIPIEIPACAVDAPHRRARIWIVANRPRHGCGEQTAGRADRERTWPGCDARAVADCSRLARDGSRETWTTTHRRAFRGCGSDTLGNAAHDRRPSEGQRPAPRHFDRPDTLWAGSETIGGRRVKPGVRLLADGIPDRLARLRALGNAVVPQVVEKIGQAIMEAEHG